DREDAVVDALNAYKREWTSNFAIKFDNATLGVTGSGGPYTSVYKALSDWETDEDAEGERITKTDGALTYEHLAAAVGDLEGSRRGELVVIAHPALKMSLRNLKDEDGERVVADPFGSGVPTVFGHEVYFSHGAAT